LGRHLGFIEITTTCNFLKGEGPVSTSQYVTSTRLRWNITRSLQGDRHHAHTRRRQTKPLPEREWSYEEVRDFSIEEEPPRDIFDYPRQEHTDFAHTGNERTVRIDANPQFTLVPGHTAATQAPDRLPITERE
jgi:hypothetical protein